MLIFGFCVALSLQPCEMCYAQTPLKYSITHSSEFLVSTPEPAHADFGVVDLGCEVSVSHFIEVGSVLYFKGVLFLYIVISTMPVAFPIFC